MRPTTIERMGYYPTDGPVIEIIQKMHSILVYICALSEQSTDKMEAKQRYYLE